MSINPETHLLEEVNFVQSPNCNQRPLGEISLIVIHNISLPPGKFGCGLVHDFFCNQLDTALDPYFVQLEGVEVSAHLLIERDGSLTQFVPFNMRAWHAGLSSYQGRENCNDFSIGIELEGTDDTAFTEAQYHQLARVTRALLKCYPEIKIDRITGHQDIAPGRKTDPGEYFDWDYFLNHI